MKQSLSDWLDQERLSEILQAFHGCTGLPAQFIDETGAVLASFGETAGYCQLLKQQAFSPSACKKAYQNAARHAQAIGETYIFACQGGLNHIAFPLQRSHELLGAVLVGPFLMDAPDSTLVAALTEQYPLRTETLLDLYDELSGVKVIPPEMVKQLSRLLFFLLSPLSPAQSRELKEARDTLYQQSRISDAIQMYKAQGEPNDEIYPYEKEKELLTKVKTGDVASAKGVLNDLLGYVFFCEGGRMETMKNRSLELCALLSRIAIEGGAVTDSVFRLNNQFLSSLSRIDSLEALCLKLQEIVEVFMSATFAVADSPGHEAVRKAIAYIARRYAQPVTLLNVADHVGLSPAYLSGIFKRCTGSTFSEYLNQVRVEESKRLLTSTGYSLVDIAMAMGFSDQSYYSKVFKKYTGLSPRQYR